MKTIAKTLWKSNSFWEWIGYIGLALCIFGQIAVGYLYIGAQVAYLVANTTAVIRDYALKLPRANIVRDWVFTIITAGLICIYYVR